MQYKDIFVTLCLPDDAYESELQEEINKMRIRIIKKKRKQKVARRVETCVAARRCASDAKTREIVKLGKDYQPFIF